MGSPGLVLGIVPVQLDQVPRPICSSAWRCICNVAFDLHSRCWYDLWPYRLWRQLKIPSRIYDVSMMRAPAANVKERPKTLKEVCAVLNIFWPSYQ